MFFIYFISITQAIQVFDEQAEPTPIPISVGVDQMKTSYLNCNTDLPCNTTIISPECGKKCWASSTTHYFEYTFKGEKYQVYASKQPNNGNFSILLDGEVVETIDSKLSPQVLRTLVYESPILTYGEHTIRAQGLGQTFEIYKFTYWPSVKAKRLNSSEIPSTGNWQLEPDKIGGTREWVNNIDATKQVTLPCSRVWIYGCKDFNYGYMNITFNGVETSIDEYKTPREEGVLLFESDELPYKEYPLLIKNGKIGDKVILSLYCIYYLDDPPLQTLAPFPSRSLVPDTSEDYINKQFRDTVPNNKIAASDTIKQVSGCTFINVMTPDTILTTFHKKLEVYDNTFIYTEEMENPAVIFIRYDYSQFHDAFTITHCTFNNMRHLYKAGEGIILAVNFDSHVKFDSCTFINIGKDSTQAFLKINGAGSHLEIIDSSFTLDDCERGCILCNFKISDVLIDGCTFTRPPNNMFNFKNDCSAGTFTFTNNVVEENKKTFINAPGMKNKPIINHNIFRNIEMTSGYLISYVHNVNEIELINNTFSHVIGKSLYCGGISSWYQNNQKNDVTIIYDSCKFYDCSNANTESPSNQGGAIQYGHSTSIMNTFLKFIDCEFKRNSCPNGMGGALGININRNLEITGCLFEDNTASDKGGAIYIWGKLVKPADNNNAPDPPASLQMESITITECKFIGNKGSDGNAIYIEEENIASVTLTISSCTFSNNGETNTQFMIVNHCGTLIFDDNDIVYTDASKTSGALSLKNSNTATITNSNFTNCIVNADATVNFVNQNENSVTTISNCKLHNCKANSFSVKMTGGISNVDSCTVSFDNAANACGSIHFGSKGFTIQNSHIIKTNAEGSLKFEQTATDPVKVINCYFDACIGPNTRCFNLKVKTTDFTFSDIVIENMVESGKKGYFGLIDGLEYSLKDLVLQNITFRNNACNCDYGGGSGLWLSKINTITFDGCTFINNIAKKSPATRDQKPDNKAYFTGDGGGIQYGFTASISNVDMIFTNCLFKENKAVRHGGAIALQTIKTIEIINCVFDNNIANYQIESADLLSIKNYFDLKKEGRGGAIYLNPSFSYDGNDYKMTSAKIEGCTFIQNKAYDGYAIYIEGDDHGTTFIINQNTFTDNYNENTLSPEKSVISSEIYNIYEGKVVESNTFNYTDPDIFLEPLLYANHSGIPPPTPSSSPFKTGADMGSNSLDGNQNTIQFECPIDRGSIKVSLSCSTCTIKSGIYFIVNFEEQKIKNVEFDPRIIYNGQTIQFFVKDSVKYDEENYHLSFNSGSTKILFEKDKTENNLKCYIPFSDIIFEDKDCSANKRCEQIINEPRPVHVFIEVSKFNNFNKTLDDGGAIHLIDCCLTCDETPFTNCESKNGGGGAIYIKNDLDYTNNVTLTNIVFTECKAQYGGAVFIHCSSDRVPITITKCHFIENEIINSNDQQAKGSALFLNVKRSIVKKCKFLGNKGGDCSFAITSEFDDSNTARILNYIDSKSFDSFLISECKFVAVKSSKSSIKIFIKNNHAIFDVIKCIFTGDLDKGSYHIEKQNNEKKSFELKINSCKFSSDLKNSLKLDQNHRINLKDSLFNYSENDDDEEIVNKYSWKLIAVVILGAFSVVTVAMAFVLIYLLKKKDNSNSNGNDHDIDNENLALNLNLI